jgi:hypothetical protein
MVRGGSKGQREAYGAVAPKSLSTKCNSTSPTLAYVGPRNHLKNERTRPAEYNRTDILLRLLAGRKWVIVSTSATFREADFTCTGSTAMTHED